MFSNFVILSEVVVRRKRTTTQSKDLVFAGTNRGAYRRSVLCSRLLITILCLAAVPCAYGQLTTATTGSSTPKTPADPLNRTTPSGSILGFLQAAQSGDYGIAAQYLDMSAARRRAEGEELANHLNAVLNDPHTFSGHVGGFTLPEGTPQEGVLLNHQKLGTMSSGDVQVDLELERVTDPNVGRIWLVSKETLAKIPELYDDVQARQGKTWLPNVLVKHHPGGMPLWQWLALLLAAPLAAGVGWIIVVLLGIPWRWWERRHGRMAGSNWRSVSGPAWLLAGTLLHVEFASSLGMPLLPWRYYFRLTYVLLIVSATWIAWRVVRWLLRRVRTRALALGHAGTGSLMLLGERIVKAAIFITGAFFVLGVLGVNLTTALAGVGIGGIAIGFGAQQTIANLFGGVSVLGDEVIRVGDYCRFGDRIGTVEDIGLRSTRIRTDDRTLVAIPNGTVATINVENFSRRDKILFKTNLGLRRDTTADHLRYLLAEIRRLLYSHPKVETAGAHARLTDFAGSSSNIEVLAYIRTADYEEFMAIREDLLLRIMEMVERSGSGLALPSQTIYLGRDAGLDKEKTEEAVERVAELRDEKQLPFPDFHRDDIAGFKGSIEYPPAESAVRNKPGDSAK